MVVVVAVSVVVDHQGPARQRNKEAHRYLTREAGKRRLGLGWIRYQMVALKVNGFILAPFSRSQSPISSFPSFPAFNRSRRLVNQ